MFGASHNKTDRAFFEAFSAHASETVHAAQLLIEMLDRLETASAPTVYVYRKNVLETQAPDHELERLAKSIKKVEEVGDTITHDTMKRLHETWITPFDRYDIHQLISRMDDV